MRTHLLQFLVILVVFTGSAVPADAQEIAGSFDQLRVLLKQGDTVRVADGAGDEVKGRIAELSASSMVLLVGGERRTISGGNVNTISRRGDDSLANGAKIGFGVGSGFGLFIAALVVASADSSGAAAAVPIGVLIYGGLGAAIGVGLDAMHTTERVIYARRAPATTAGFGVAPTLTAARKGAALTLRF